MTKTKTANKSGPAICQTCGIILRGKVVRCSSCNGFVSKYSPTPLSTFGPKESAPISSVTFRTDHLLLERVLIIAQTNKLIWQSPCQNGDCIHVERNGDEVAAADESDSSSESSVAVGQEEDPSTEVKQSEKKDVEPSPEIVEEPEPEKKDDSLGIVIEEDEYAGWKLTLNGINADGIRNGIQIAMEDIDSFPLPAAQSFSATNLVFGPSLDERVITADPQDLSAFYEESLRQYKETKTKEDSVAKKSDQSESEKASKDVSDSMQSSDNGEKKPAVFHGSYAEVEKTAAAIFDAPTKEEDAKQLNDAFNSALSSENTASDASERDSDLGSDEWPDDGYERGRGNSAKKPGDKEEQSDKGKSPYTSEFDLTGIKVPGAAPSDQLKQGAAFSKKGSLLGGLLKVVLITGVFVVIGLVGLFALGGNQTTATDGGAIMKNETGLPDISGNWHINLTVETPQGNVTYGEVNTSVKLVGDQISGEGEDAYGKYNISGSVGTNKDQVVIAFAKSYDGRDGRQHPYQTNFSGFVAPTQGSNVLAQGTFTNRLLEDMPKLNKHKYEKINGYWALSLVSESLVDKVQKMVGN